MILIAIASVVFALVGCNSERIESGGEGACLGAPSAAADATQKELKDYSYECARLANVVRDATQKELKGRPPLGNGALHVPRDATQKELKGSLRPRLPPRPL